MKKSKKNLKANARAYFYAVLSLTILSLLLAYLYFVINKNTPGQEPSNYPENINLSPPTEQEKKESNSNKDVIIQNMDKPVDTNQSSSAPISVTITRASRSNVSVYIEKLSEGTCSLSVTQNGIEKISMNTKIESQTDYSTCEGFSLDPNKLDSSPLKVIVTVNSGDRKGTVSQEIN